MRKDLYIILAILLLFSPLIFCQNEISAGNHANIQLSNLEEIKSYTQVIYEGIKYLQDPQIKEDKEFIDDIYRHLLIAYIEQGRVYTEIKDIEKVVLSYQKGAMIAEELFALDKIEGIGNLYYMPYRHFYSEYFNFFSYLREFNFRKMAAQRLQNIQSDQQSL